MWNKGPNFTFLSTFQNHIDKFKVSTWLHLLENVGWYCPWFTSFRRLDFVFFGPFEFGCKSIIFSNVGQYSKKLSWFPNNTDQSTLNRICTQPNFLIAGVHLVQDTTQNVNLQRILTVHWTFLLRCVSIFQARSDNLKIVQPGMFIEWVKILPNSIFFRRRNTFGNQSTVEPNPFPSSH